MESNLAGVEGDREIGRHIHMNENIFYVFWLSLSNSAIANFYAPEDFL